MKPEDFLTLNRHVSPFPYLLRSPCPTLERSFRRRHARSPVVRLSGVVQRTSKRLEYRLDHVVCVLAVQDLNVKGQTCPEA